MSEEAFKVKVYVYDLTHGLAALYSPMILGTTIDAIYHTLVVVYNKEYYIDQGIKVTSQPGSTKYGIPKEVLDLGETYITEDILDEFLQELKDREDQKYHASNYDLFENNCNHFTDVVLEFLVGKNLEDRILNLPQQVLLTPRGQMLHQLIGNGALI
ncbi:uncharacterized protein PRCAT00000804001 [Priceomyces carsonii]|uniref:uncharacterized protein n=1 Tax=Priceomyces carsonii TaxID=28549 RepID=UPI002ED9781E|nr:unnamed protein product [Priceomyces carsonii]